jgi:hypothetical protein|tara:strand:+ start:647 stop:832 length:186 start_codon:yes stop_codon:yes gene_type:complete
MKKRINVNDDVFVILGTVSVNKGYTPDKLKSMWRLADAVLRNNNDYYICMKCVNAEFEDIN